MSICQWFIFFIIIQVIHFLGTWKLYIIAGRKSWEALIPIYNAIILMKIIDRPTWWTILLFIPVINLIMFPVIWVETLRSFGKNSSGDTFLVILTLGFYIYYINYTQNLSYKAEKNLVSENKPSDTLSSLLFAVIVATLVHTYVIQPFTIPSSSLEKTLYIGDFLFVSKINFGARVPMTTIALPMVHDSIPVLGIKSYLFSDDITQKETSILNKFQFPYFRLPSIESIKRNEIVVFNQPADTLLDMNNFKPARNYYKPIDKKTNLVKRCVAISGDSLEIREGNVYINGKLSKLPESAKLQYNFFINTEGTNMDQGSLVNMYGARDGLKDQNGNFALNNDGQYVLTLTDSEASRIANNPVVKSVKKYLLPKGVDGDVFPHIHALGWNIDNFGPIYIPKKGAKVKLDKKSLPFYKRIIQEYEKNTLQIDGDKIIINGKLANSYTFKQDYYWMMGDNRQNSLDARYWGYVPFDHVVGKPVFIWFSWDKDGKGIQKVRWNRVFSFVNEKGESKSYLIHFLIILAAFFVGEYFWKKRKAKKA